MSLHVFMTRIPNLAVQILRSRKKLSLAKTGISVASSAAIVTFSRPNVMIHSMLFLRTGN